MSDNKFKVPAKAFWLQFLAARGVTNWIPDKLFIQLSYQFNMGKSLNLEHPQTYNEKLQWLKLYDRKPEYTKMVDKYAVRTYVSKRIGDEYLIPLLGVWNQPDEINYDKLPNQFVLKCNHDSGGVLICKDKSELDINAATKFLRKCLSRNFYYRAREWPYKNIKRKIIAEKYMVDESGYELKDYKFFCFNGKCRAVFIATDRGADTRFDFFDPEFHHLPIKCGHDNAEKEIKKPASWELMIKLAEKLSEGIPQVRVDLYDVFGQVYFGELTFFHFGGKKPFYPEKWDYVFGSWIDLPDKG